MSETREILLTRGMTAIVDASDYDWLMQWSWAALKSDDRFYAARATFRGRVHKTHLMHREILKAPKGTFVDHIDRNSLNNTRQNLRLCTNAQNCLNRVGYQNGKKTSRFKGVWWNPRNENWNARFRNKFLGVFTDEEEAARAYDAAALAYSPEFALPNFRQGGAPCQA